MNSPLPPPDDALAHLGWVRSLALGLARDANVAEDVVQDAYLLALERPPRRSSRLGPWLARVTRTFARQEARATRSRRAREEVAAREAAGRESEEPSEVVQRGERQRVVADAVLRLPEPYASTVLYHYLDGLSTVEVAQSMATTPATVRKRLERGRALLREELDREFGCETQSWALGLLPLADWRATAAATGATGAGAQALIASGIMSSKVLGWSALVVVGGLLFLGRGYFLGNAAGAEKGSEARVETVLPEVEGLNLEILPGIPVEVERAEVAQVSGPGHRTSVPEIVESADGVVLLVRAIASDGSELTTGEIDCFWDPRERLGHSSGQRHLARPIRSAVTRIELPPEARSVRVAVSHADYPPCPEVELRALRTDADGEALRGLVEHEVDVSMADTAEGPFVHGDIRLDGRLKCPPGLRVFINGQGHAWINSITSSYRFGPIGERSSALHVVSDFSLPARYELDEGARSDRRIDLELESGRELLVHAVDETTGAPAVGREVTLQVSNPVEKTLFRVLSHSHEQSARVDAAGNCRFQGIPIEGHVYVSQRLGDGGGKRVLESLRLTPDLPALVELEVRLGSTEPVRTRVFGSLPGEPSAASEGARTVRLMSLQGGGVHTTDVDAEGQWSIEVDSHQMWSARAQLGGRPRSDEAVFELRGEAEHGPVQLGWRGALALTLRMIDVPAAGEVVIECIETDGGARQRHQLEARGEDLALELALSGSAKIELILVPTGGDTELGRRWKLELDPARENERIVDLEGSRAVGLSLRIAGAFPEGEGHLLLISPGPGEGELRRAMFTLHEGQAVEPQTLDSGQWMYLLRHASYPGFVAGWLDVPERPPASFELEWQGAPKPTAELGTGLAIRSIAGRDLESWFPPFARYPWQGNLRQEEVLWLPSEIDYDVME